MRFVQRYLLSLMKCQGANFMDHILHDLSCHSGQQYEIVCLRSVNAECQERLFGQAKRTALNTTNRKPNNVIPEILLRLQMGRKKVP